MTQEKKPLDKAEYQERFDNLKKGIYTSSLDYKLIENLQNHLAELTAFQDTPDLPQEIREDLSKFFWELHTLIKQILNFQKELVITPKDEQQKLVRVK